MFLLDTMVLSELRKPQPDRGVLEWIRPLPARDLFVSSITLGEVELGIEKQRPRTPASQPNSLTGWR